MAESSTHVELRFPGSPDFLRLARLAAADAASRAGLDVDEIEDVRIAVSELCAIVGGDGVEITLEFTNHDGVLHVAGSGGPGELDGDNTEMAQALIAAVVDEYETRTEDGRTAFSIVKRAASLTPQP
jgi:serine/threonine-protein kinase RsbW